ncbi:MAG: ATP-binding protein [Vicinamibacterales bacterium]
MTRWWRSHSVRVRLTLWYVFAMVLVLGVYAAAVFTFVSRNASETLDQRLRGDFQWAAAMVGQTPEGRITSFDDDDPLVDEERPWLQVWSPEGDLLFQNDEAVVRPIPQSRQLATLADDRVVTVGTTTPMRVLTRRGRIGPKSVVIQVARSEGPMRQQLQELVLIFVFGLPAAVAVAGLGGFGLAKRALSPVEHITERARTISAERLSDRLPVANPDDEMGQLATVFNETLGRLELSFDQMRRFTADVSHELRTPLTAIRSVGEVGLRGQRDEGAYRAIIGSMLEEVDRLASLVDRLLTLSRAETGQSRLNLEEVDLVKLAEDVVAHLSVLAEEQGQSVVVNAQAAPHATADRQVVRQALINLVDNAIKFSGAGGRVDVSLGDTGRAVTIDVSDTGPGIPEDARELIFDRFYRSSDTSHRTPGSGLGLSIARGAVEASGGTLSLERTTPQGSTFRISLPRATPQSLAQREAS